MGTQSQSAVLPKGGPARIVEHSAAGRQAFVHEDIDTSLKTLEADLKACVAGEVHFDTGTRALYATDSSNYRQVPIGVVIPRTHDDVRATLVVCRRLGAPVLSRGCGTDLSGATCNTAVVIDFSKYLNRLVALDPERHSARAEAGCILDHVRDAAEAHHLTFGPDPATHGHCTIGGMIGNNSGGVHAVMNGITVNNVISMNVLLADGTPLEVGPTPPDRLETILSSGGREAELYRRLIAFRERWGDRIRERFPQIPRRVSGYANLDQLFEENGFNVARALVGTEGTCVTVLDAELLLIPSPQANALAIIGFEDIFAAADAVPETLRHEPIGLEGMDHLLADFVRMKGEGKEALSLLPEGKGWLLAQMGADTDAEAERRARALCRTFEERGNPCSVITAEDDRDRVWSVREAALAATAWVPDSPDTWEGWEDSAVHRENLGDYLREFKALLHRYGYEASLYGHFGDGLVHCRIDFGLRTEEGVAHWRRFLDDAADLVHRFDGSLSGEHGDGQARGELLERMYGPELIEAFREFKAIWDPEGRMNPGKVVDPYPITSNLRVGPAYQPPRLETNFAFPDDEGSFPRAAMRCVGVGKCRRTDQDGEVMCPSFLVTREERHSTRGRARLLFEMVRGGTIEDGWKSREVEEALSLCLACKGCKSDCPVNVDMATYKAEFRSHHYKGRLRSRSAYAVGLIHRWAPLAAKVPGLANALTHAPVLSWLSKAVGGIAGDVNLPRFASTTFRASFERRNTSRASERPPVMLWPDTFTNYFRPEVAIAATEVLEAAGFEVTIPQRQLCCGRALYDEGMLTTARRLWQRTFEALKPAIEGGVPIIGLEPACTTAFKDELLNLFPEHDAARRLSEQTIFFSDFLAGHIDRLDLRASGQRALVHPHCNHHAVLKTDGERKLLDALGLDHRLSRAGCCGMAGAFGLASQTREVAKAVGERALLPMVRALDEDEAIIADGFSCREQIEQGTDRKTLHIAELINRMRKSQEHQR